jgi:predicted nuclease of predicted toxin-antitoxin system
VNFKIDENLPLVVAKTLRDAGFDVETVWDEALSGAADEVIADRVQHESRVLLTLDLDFANIQAYPPDRFSGIVVLRSKTQDTPTLVAYVRKFMAVLQHRSPVGELWIVQRDRVRFRQGG